MRHSSTSEPFRQGSLVPVLRRHALSLLVVIGTFPRKGQSLTKSTGLASLNTNSLCLAGAAQHARELPRVCCGSSPRRDFLWHGSG